LKKRKIKITVLWEDGIVTVIVQRGDDIAMSATQETTIELAEIVSEKLLKELLKNV